MHGVSDTQPEGTLLPTWHTVWPYGQEIDSIAATHTESTEGILWRNVPFQSNQNA